MRLTLIFRVYLAALASAVGLASCQSTSDSSPEPSRHWECVLSTEEVGEGDVAPGVAGGGGGGPVEEPSSGTDFLQEIGCLSDFTALASVPLDASIPGARSVKILVDTDFDNGFYFQNSQKYQIHYEFAAAHLSVAQGFPPVGSLAEFNGEQYTSSLRRFILAAVTHYEGPDIWAFELSPYDTASAEMIDLAFGLARENAYFGKDLRFHPTSEAIKATALDLSDDVPIVTTDEIFAGTDYQALNVAESYGRLRFMTASEITEGFLSFRDIVVLDQVPNDISVTSGIITSEFQTPLAHINVLSQNRGTPNMAYRGAYDLERFRDLEDKWVRLKVGPFDYELEEVSQEEADAWWDANKPSAVQVPGANLEITELTDVEDIVTIIDPADGPALLATIKEGTRAFGGKASNYAVLAHIDGLPIPDAFSVPIYYYFQFMEENGFDVHVDSLLSDEDFQTDPVARSEALADLRSEMMLAPVNADFEVLLTEKIAADYPEGTRMRFRSSTNAEDLDGFTGAGLYTSKSGALDDPKDPILDAVREVWSSVWYFRAFEERTYRSIDHQAVGMALLVHPSFPDEEANGVALTANPFDKSGLDPAFYINVQEGEESVVQPPPGVSTDELLYYYGQPGQPTTYLSHSTRVPAGQTVLTRSQVRDLGDALLRIHQFFAPAYGPGFGSSAWWAMDVEFKFDDIGADEPQLFVKQARPFGNR
jgi:pyruvate, water dikinase